MTNTTHAATRVDATTVDTTETIQVTLPRFLAVHIPAARETRFYDLANVPVEALIAGLEHGKSQQLGDAAAGKAAGSLEAREMVDKREKTLWADGRVSVDPVTSEMHRLAHLVLKAAGAKTKDLPSLKAFPEWLAAQDAAEAAKLRKAAEASIAARKAQTDALKAAGLNISL